MRPGWCRLTLLVLVLWVLAGPLAAAFGPCADMGAMCEGPCAVGVTAPMTPVSTLVLPLVAEVPAWPRDHRPSPSLKVAEPPPKSLLLSA